MPASPACRCAGRRCRSDAMLRPIGYREVAPPSDLADIVECFWTTAGTQEAPYRILPDGCMDFVFDFSAAPGGGTALIGTMRQARVVPARRRADLIGVRFLTGGITSC